MTGLILTGFHRWVQYLTALIPLLALPGALAFPLLYSAVQWYRSHLGRAVMMLSLGVAGIIVLAAIRVMADFPHISTTYAGDPVEVDLIRLGVYAWLFVAVYYQLAVLLVVTRRGTDLHTDDAEVRSQPSPGSGSSDPVDSS